MKNFENIYILRGSMTENEALEEIEKIKKYFKNTKIVEKIDTINGYQGKKNLAYDVKGEKTGYYYITHFEGTESKVEKIETQLRLNENVLKFVTIREI